MRPYTRFNKGYHYILTVIDVLSKHAWALPLKTKSGNKMATAIAKIIRGDGRCPKNLQTDMGKEFYTQTYENYELHHVANPEVYLVEKVLRKKGDKVYVKWLGFDGSHNSWINKQNVV
ncbi:hypothetical protein ALC62_02645 [Cyphomyrmex costatus]|uniref:Chromo domain-containing protein n=1 Tax=Cyphomyrmex costatus TaxID=456900 RepID=A0A151IN13_9HYME|nr:hypothetical protein ALC62_02645 [Cyphomyrmex costatus]